ncbi:hypothetical protein P154DRAFT_616551 [Amniculicola lignicola CBS 123094]|uniref:Uncharacterized protein n=1 Tax=Amniculicola lignicola CBS 123094 TaxID=1392246 RepID=A0A6A5WUR4_9PLEO|nr:hypothetical protein P154DRAFT_616551 [Amniculicola lignicola CBS 123094]
MGGILRRYTDYVKEQASLDRSLQGLADFLQDLNGRQQFPVNVFCIDFAPGRTCAPQPWRIDPGDGYPPCPTSAGWTPYGNIANTKSPETPHKDVKVKKLRQVTTIPDDIRGRIIVVEDMNRYTVAHLGVRYNLPLSFFATYLTTELPTADHEPQPPTIALPPSKMLGDQDIHLQYQRVIDLGTTKQREKLYVRSNVRRLVRPTPLLNKRCPGLARSCCSLYLCRDEKDKWICIVLVDATNAEFENTDAVPLKISRPQPVQRNRHASKAFDFRAWEEARKLQSSNKEPSSGIEEDPHGSNSLLNSLVRLFQDAPCASNTTHIPNVLSFAYFPTQLVLAEWMQYALLLSRYVKHYEYALISPNAGLKQSKVKELLPWRRRCIRSGLKLELLRRSVKHHILIVGTSEVQGRWRPVLEDIDHVSSQLAEWATFLNSMVPLLDSHQSLIEAQSVRHLTYIVLVFSSLSLVASIFSMSEKVLPWGGGHAWLYFAVALPLTAVVLGSYFLFLNIVGRLLRG